MKWKSCAIWPKDCCPSIGNRSSDEHESRTQASCVCNILERNGFGGDGVYFPIYTWVEPILENSEPDTSKDNCCHKCNKPMITTPICIHCGIIPVVSTLTNYKELLISAMALVDSAVPLIKDAETIGVGPKDWMKEKDSLDLKLGRVTKDIYG